MKLYIANVGVNTNDALSGIRSPIFPDQRFEFIPIMESKGDSKFTPNKYSTLKCYNNPELTLSYYIKNEEYSNYAVHNDPEFNTFTYGDINTPRASNLKHIVTNDIILFLARLYEYKGGRFTDNKGNIYFIGCFTIEENKEFDNWKIDLHTEKCDKWRKNAHFIKFINGKMERFRILKGFHERSYRFRKALLIDQKVVELVFCGKYDQKNDTFIKRDGEVAKNGTEVKFSKFSSKTRSIQSYLDDKEPTECDCIKKLLEEIRKQL